VFPRLDIRNVVEASKEVTISNWCSFGHSTCHHEFSVRPFRCLGIIIFAAAAAAAVSASLSYCVTVQVVWVFVEDL